MSHILYNNFHQSTILISTKISKGIRGNFPLTSGAVKTQNFDFVVHDRRACYFSKDCFQVV